jgi:Asp-tRNA(Asn)/Glu-tRNA(Gln) amidotransferase A subunit family amidase
MSREPLPVGYLNFDSVEQFIERLNGFMGETALFNQTGQPSISLPLHWTQNQLPMGMMFSAAFGNDALLLQLAGQLEQARPWWDRRPPVHAGRRGPCE